MLRPMRRPGTPPWPGSVSRDLCDAPWCVASGSGRKLAVNDEAGRVVAERELGAMQSRHGRGETQAEAAASSLAGGITDAHERT